MPKRPLHIATAVLLLVGAAAVGVGYFMTFSPDRARHPVRGVDVSHHQGAIDWRRVAADDVSFAIIKATEGGDHVDTRFARNIEEARAAGLAVGAYHFFTFCRSGAEQARNFLATVPRDQPLLPPAVDIEFQGNCARRPSGVELAAELTAFLEPVEAAFGKTAVVYLVGEAADAYAGRLPPRPRWVRSLAWPPADDGWTYWQYHDRGRVNGIEGGVDLNVLRGGPAELARLFSEAR